MISFCKTDIGHEEMAAVQKVIDSGWVVLGERSKEFEQMFAEYVGAKHAVFLDSCTSALFLALKWAYGDNKLQLRVPSFTFAATAEAIVHAGHQPVFVDVGDDLCMKQVDHWSLPVHLTGNRAFDGARVYDSAHRIEKNDVKNSDALWCYSFYATKNMTTVQGGMIATNSDAAAHWLRKARDHGLTSGTKERYTKAFKPYDVEFVGWRFKGDDMRAAMGIEQLKKLPRLNMKRNELVARYNKALGLKRTGNHLYPIFVHERVRFIEKLFEEGIQTSVHFSPLHKMTAYKGALTADLSNTEWFGERIVSLPLFPQLTFDEQDHIIKTVKETGCLIER